MKYYFYSGTVKTINETLPISGIILADNPSDAFSQVANYWIDNGQKPSIVHISTLHRVE